MANMWCISFTVIMLLIPISLLPQDSHSFIYLICISALVAVYICIKVFRTFSKVEDLPDTIEVQEIDERRQFHEAREFYQSIARNNTWSTRQHYIPDSQINMSFGTIAEIARWAMRALPPVRSFNGSGNMDCPICIEEFEKRELIQSFGVCGHEFHTSCLNSWLLGGKTTCPVCRLDLSSST
ncbi:hypothetical protein TSUD_62320 [Trifolium subterraneum]|uniref:RING-type domain-containing protein n=1 Tax=Trifolium subterraneum TaxID=3900 RepID=A0A2Z6N0U2_TRISU|nr:hypothetical protein TSUD_62320 [Trifolium subterraneum]